MKADCTRWGLKYSSKPVKQFWRKTIKINMNCVLSLSLPLSVPASLPLFLPPSLHHITIPVRASDGLDDSYLLQLVPEKPWLYFIELVSGQVWGGSGFDWNILPARQIHSTWIKRQSTHLLTPSYLSDWIWNSKRKSPKDSIVLLCF